jgi:hypothetical protein
VGSWSVYNAGAMEYHPLSLLVACAIALPILNPRGMIHHYRYIVALGAIMFGIASAWALKGAGLLEKSPQDIIEHALAAVALIVVAVRALYEARQEDSSKPAQPRVEQWTGKFPAMKAEFDKGPTPVDRAQDQ